MKLCLLAIAMAVASIGAAQAQDVSSEKGKVSYALGYDLGRRLSESKIEVDTATLLRAIQDGLASRNPALSDKQMQQIMGTVQQKQLAKVKADFDKIAAENKAASDWFMAKNHARAFVKTLPSGIQYRVLEEGNGPTPRADGQVKIMYKASISTGKVFATSYGGDGVPAQPITVNISESPLAGIKQILPMMKQGAHWEVVLPPDQAYGGGPDSPIGPNQVVIFDLKVVEVLK
jgi:FKBP-type peptidyl-prolyl cis-trans isomerase